MQSHQLDEEPPAKRGPVSEPEYIFKLMGRLAVPIFSRDLFEKDAKRPYSDLAERNLERAQRAERSLLRKTAISH